MSNNNIQNITSDLDTITNQVSNMCLSIQQHNIRQYQNHIGNMDSLLADINTLTIADADSSVSSMTTEYDNDNEYQRESNPLYNKLVPIEVANYYCKEYFDDEDFVFMTLELPYDLMDEIMNDGNNSISEYFYSFMNNIEIDNDDHDEVLYYSIYDNCIKVYEKLLEYYSPSWYGNDLPHDPNNYSTFDKEWTLSSRIMINFIEIALYMGLHDDSLKYLCNYNKEVYTGLYIITSRVQAINNQYHTKKVLNDFYHNEQDNRRNYVRLVNNLCVILLYLKFYYLKNGCESNKEITPNEDSMITLEE